MGLFDRFTKKADSSHSLPRDFENAFRPISNYLDSEEDQNRKAPPRLQELMIAGGAIDGLPNAAGEFGRDVRNPIPVNGPVGELVYLSSLMTPAGTPIIGHRLGSVQKRDLYETVTIDGSRWDLLFFDMYHTRKSKRLPAGYQLSKITFLLATDKCVVQFPMGMIGALRESSQQVLGTPLVDPRMRDDKVFRGFVRPLGHVLAIESLGLKFNARWSQ